jgi:RNA polymerase sigma-B factor
VLAHLQAGARGAAGVVAVVSVSLEEIDNATHTAQVWVARIFARRLQFLPAAGREDLEQVVRIAVWEAAARFDPERGLPFIAYALPVAKGRAQHAIRQAWHFGKTGRKAREKQSKAMRPNEPHEDCPVSLETTEFAEPGSNHPLPLKDALPSPRDPVEAALVRASVWQETDGLPAREAAILLLRYRDGWNQTRVGEALGCSQMQVSRLERRALGRLRGMLEGETP